MNLKEISTPATTKAIYQHYIDNQKDWRRKHLGASGIGRSCHRAIWYSWRWCTKPNYDGRKLKLFARGHKEEDNFIRDLEAIGIETDTMDKKTGEQYRFSADFGHFAGACDGFGRGFAESKAWHLLEFKGLANTYFNQLAKKGLLEYSTTYYAQTQIYMHWSKVIKRCMFLAVNKNTDELYQERIKYDKEYALKIEDKAKSIIDSQTPPDKISDKPNYYVCNMCEHKKICHAGVPEVNCRTCAHSTATMGDGCQWRCKHDTVDYEKQKIGCPQHIYIPNFIGDVLDVSLKENWVEYQSKDNVYFKNGNGFYSSLEIQKMINNNIDFKRVNDIKDVFDGAEVGEVK